jgi:hypothetical protein
MLLAAVLPLASIALAIVGIINLKDAITIALAGSLGLLIIWSVLSSQAFKAGRIGTVVLAILELTVGLVVISLKAVGH